MGLLPLVVEADTPTWVPKIDRLVSVGQPVAVDYDIDVVPRTNHGIWQTSGPVHPETGLRLTRNRGLAALAAAAPQAA